VTRPQLTVRARLTLLYSGLFTVCGVIVVAVSYILVAQLDPSQQGPQPSDRNVPASVAALCRSELANPHPASQAAAKCNDFLLYQGAVHQREVILSHLLEYSLITLGVVIVLAAALGWIFSGRALRPVHRITAAARAATHHNLADRVALHGPRDELRELAETFDEMLDRLQAAFDAQQRFIANASHELRTPLAVMRTTVDVVANNPASTPDDLRAMAADIRTAVDHAEHLINALLILARNERGLTVRDEVDLATIAEDVLDTAALGNRHVHATLEPAVISGDPVLAEHLVANLVDNAACYNTPTGDIWITTHSKNGTSQLTVANTGPLISPADISRIFQPFQRLNDRTSHDGFGLGLAIVASIATIHGGTATALPRRGGGLTVTVTIPSASVAAAQGTRAHGTGTTAAPRHTDLTVNDAQPTVDPDHARRSSVGNPQPAVSHTVSTAVPLWRRPST
jgi:signal transduction histidine kinase